MRMICRCDWPTRILVSPENLRAKGVGIATVIGLIRPGGSRSVVREPRLKCRQGPGIEQIHLIEQEHGPDAHQLRGHQVLVEQILARARVRRQQDHQLGQVGGRGLSRPL